jgi:hypothetical protein
MSELTWEDLERQSSGQLQLPGLTYAPTVAERAFLTLAREWQVQVQGTPEGRPLPHSADVLALSCLLLSAEWGTEFSAVATSQMEINRLLVAIRQTPSSYDELPWELCEASRLTAPSDSQAVQWMTESLDHPDSSIRIWMMKIGWFTRPWLSPDKAPRRLLNNLATTLGGPFMAAGLAARFFATTDDFMEFAQSYVAPLAYNDQYQDRLRCISEYGILEVQAPFWQLECECRWAIEQVSLGLRLRPESH